MNDNPSQVAKVQKGVRHMENVGPVLQFFNQFLPWIEAMVVLLILLVSYFFILGPKLTEVVDQQQSFLPERRSTLEAMQSIETRLRTLEQKFNQLKVARQGDLDILQKALPEQPDYAGLFAQAEFLANQNNIDLQSVDITQGADNNLTERKEPDAQQAGSASEQALGNLPKDVATLTVNLQLGEASYEQIKNFLDTLEKHLRLFNIQSISFGSISGETETVSNFNIVLVTYYRQTTEIKEGVRP